MADRRKTITISVEDDFSRQLQKFARLVGEAGNEVDKLPAKGQDLGKTADRFNEISNAAMTMFGWVKGGVEQIVQLANEGIKIKQTAASFEQLAGGAANAEQWITAIKTASRGGLTDFEATGQAIQLMTMGLADSAEEAGRFMEVAAITKAINPELGSMENTITNIGMTLANDSWMRLDQLGVDATKLKTRMKELEAQGIATTEAFDIGVMEQLEANAAIIGTEVLDIGQNTTEMQTAWREMKEAASEFALILTEAVAPAITDLIKGTTEFVSGWNLLLSGKDSLLSGVFSDGKWTEQDEEDFQRGLEQQKAAEKKMIEKNLQGSSDEYLALMERYAEMTYDEQQALLVKMLTGEMVPSDLTWAGVISNEIPDYNTISGGRRGDPMAGAGVFQALTGYTAPSPLPQRDQTPYLPGYDPSTSFQLPTDYKNDLLDMMDGIQEAPSIATTAGEGIAGAFSSAFQSGSEAAQKFYDEWMEEEAKAQEAYNNMTVADRFGVDAIGFDVDVGRRMKSALDVADVDIDAASEALLTFALMTGQATAGTEVFEGQMDKLSQSLAEGKITADQYAQQVSALSMMDLSTFNSMIEQQVSAGDFEGAREYLDYLSTMDLTGLQALIDVTQAQQEDSEKASQWQPMIDEAKEAEGELTTSAETIRDAYIKSLDETTMQGGAAFGLLRKRAIEDMTEIVDFIGANFTGGEFVFSVTSRVGESEIGSTGDAITNSQNLPEFAEGGFTGTGTGPFPAMLHPNEMVIPLNKLPMGGGSSGGAVQVDLYIDGRQVESAVANAKRLKNEAF